MKINDLYERIEQINRKLQKAYQNEDVYMAACFISIIDRLETIIRKLEEHDIDEVKTIVVSNILWDMDDEELPQVYYIDVDMHNVNLLEDIFGQAQYLSDYISDKFGFCHSGFDVELCA